MVTNRLPSTGFLAEGPQWRPQQIPPPNIDAMAPGGFNPVPSYEHGAWLAHANSAGMRALVGSVGVRGQRVRANIFYDPSSGNYIEAAQAPAGGGSWYGGVYFPADVVAAAQAGSAPATAAVVALNDVAQLNLAVNPNPPATIVATEPPVGGGSAAGIPTGRVYDTTVPPNSPTSPAASVVGGTAPGPAQTNVPSPGQTAPPPSTPGGTIPGTVKTTVAPKARTNHPTTASLYVIVQSAGPPPVGATVTLLTAAGGDTGKTATAVNSPSVNAPLAGIQSIPPGQYKYRVTLTGYGDFMSSPFTLTADQDFQTTALLVAGTGAMVVAVRGGMPLGPVVGANVTARLASADPTAGGSSGVTDAKGEVRLKNLAVGSYVVSAQKQGVGTASQQAPVQGGHETAITLTLSLTASPGPLPQHRGVPALLVGAAALAVFAVVAGSEEESLFGKPKAQGQRVRRHDR